MRNTVSLCSFVCVCGWVCVCVCATAHTNKRISFPFHWIASTCSFLSGIFVVIPFQSARTNHSAFRLRLLLSPKFYCSNCQNTLPSQFGSHVSIKTTQRMLHWATNYSCIYQFEDRKKHRRHHCTLLNIVLYLYIYLFTNIFLQSLSILTDGISLVNCGTQAVLIYPSVVLYKLKHESKMKSEGRRN